jgi:Family of unknown function (DUF6527)
VNILNWFKKRRVVRHAPKYFGTIVFVEGISEVPDDIGKDVYIVRRARRNIWVVFMCPCDKSHRLTVNLSASRKPYWRAKTKQGNFSLSPSIWLDDDCYSHFWVDNHRVVWVTDRPT